MRMQRSKQKAMAMANAAAAAEANSNANTTSDKEAKPGSPSNSFKSDAVAGVESDILVVIPSISQSSANPATPACSQSVSEKTSQPLQRRNTSPQSNPPAKKRKNNKQRPGTLYREGRRFIYL
jgi:hypothetical protein